MKRREILVGGLAAAAVTALPKIAGGEEKRRVAKAVRRGRAKRILRFDFPGATMGRSYHVVSTPTWGDGAVTAYEFAGPTALLLNAHFSLFVLSERASWNWKREAKEYLSAPVHYLPFGLAEHMSDISTACKVGPIYLMRPIAYRYGFDVIVSTDKARATGTIEMKLHLA